MSAIRSIPFLFVCLVLGCPNLAFAQRYLSEFVGTSTLKQSLGSRQLTSNLVFEALDNRRLQGMFSLVDSFDSDGDAFLVDGTLAASGNCNVQLQSLSSSGGLNLVEVPFDDQSFALIGRATVNSGPASLLSIGKHTGGVAVLRPVTDGVPIKSSGITSISLRSALTGLTSVHGVVINHEEASHAVSGIVTGTGALSGYAFTASANSRWTYLVGQNGSRFIAMRVQSAVSSIGELDGFTGIYQIYEASGKVVDSGTITGR